MTKQDLIVGDARLELPKLESGSVDLIVADPPYNLGKNYGNNRDSQAFDDYLSFTRAWLHEAKRLLSSRGAIYVFMGYRLISYVFAILERELKMYFNSWIVWHYTQGIGRVKGFSPRHDDILMFTKSRDFTFNLDSVRVPQKYYRERNNMRGANPGDVWEFSHIHYCNENRQNHPTQKPEGLIERLVLASSNENDCVLDPFSGSGTTLRVCQQLDRRGIGIEINPDYVKMSRERLNAEFTGFDSVDPRMRRVPRDLSDKSIREAYLENHRRWFLNNTRADALGFEESVRSLYEGENSIGVEQLDLL